MATRTVDSRQVDLSDTARERTSERLLRSSATTTYDPVVDIETATVILLHIDMTQTLLSGRGDDAGPNCPPDSIE